MRIHIQLKDNPSLRTFDVLLSNNLFRYESSVSLSATSFGTESSTNNRNPSRSAFDADLKYDLGLKWVTSEGG